MKDQPADSNGSSSTPKTSNRKERPLNHAQETETNPNLDRMLAAPQVGVLLIDDKKKIVTANDAAVTLFGTSELVGKDASAVFKDGLQNEFGRLLQRKVQPDKPMMRFSCNVTALCKGGPEVPVSAILTRNSADGKVWWTALFRKLDKGEQGNPQRDIFQGATDELQKHCFSMVRETTSFREQLDSLQKERDDLSGKLNSSEATVSELELQLAETRRQLDLAQNGTAIVVRDMENGLAQNDRLKEELVALRQMCDDLTEKLSSEQLASADSAKYVANLEKQVKETSRSETKLQSQLQTLNHQLEELTSQRAEEEQRTRQLAGESEELRHTLQTLEATRAEERETLTKATSRQEELEAQLKAKTEEFEAGLKAKDEEIEQARQEAATLNLPEGQGDWVQELGRLREAESSFQVERSNLEHRVREGVAALARVTAERDRERQERRRIEQRSSSLGTQLQEMHEELKRQLESERQAQDRIAELEGQMRGHEESVSRLREELREEEAGRQLAEEQLNLAGDMKGQVDNYRNLFETSKETFNRSREELESKLQATVNSLNETEGKLRHEAEERQRLQEALAMLQKHHDRGALEFSKLQSELDVERLERKRLEGDATLSRYVSLDSARVNRAQTSTLKRQLRQPVDVLLHSARSLLEVELAEEPRKLVEALLENSLLVQTCLQEGSPEGGESQEASGEVHQAA